MPACRERRDPRDDLRRLRRKQTPQTPVIDSLHPFLIRSGNIHRALERRGPGQMGRVVVRVTYNNSFEAALGVYPGDCGGVEQREAVPEHVTVGGFDQDCALADGEFGGCDDGPEVWVRVDLGPGIGVFGGEVGAGGPFLAGWGDVLAWVLWFGCVGLDGGALLLLLF